jgi:hypothetical protein
MLPQAMPIGNRGVGTDAVVDSLYNAGVAAYNRSDYAAAVRAFTHATRLDSAGCKTWLYLGISASLSQNSNTALRALNRADSSCGTGNRILAAFYRGVAQWEKEQLTAAHRSFSAVAAQTDDPVMAAHAKATLVRLEAATQDPDTVAAP